MIATCRRGAQASLLALAMTLTACGGGGGGSVGSTPTPTPGTSTPTPTPVGTNDDLLTPMVSENFANIAAVASGTFPKDGSLPTLSATPETASISYDAGSQSYTVTAGARSQTFTPANIDSSLSDPTIVAYVRRAGLTSDSLVLTRPGTSGRYTFQYVGGAYWQRTVDGTSTITGSIDALTYGVRTPLAATPTSGRAEYALDVIGAQTYGGSVVGIRGEATLKLDLGNSMLTLSGMFGPVGIGQTFNGTSSFTSGSQNFAGGFSVFAGASSLQGTFAGNFYGPSAQEVGLTFSAVDSARRDAAVGSMIGRGGKLAGPVFDAAKAVAAQAGLTTTYNPTAKTFSGSSARDVPPEARFDSATGTYTLINSEKWATALLGNPVTFVRDTDIITSQPTGWTYVQALRWTEKLAPLTGSDRYRVTDFIRGTVTPDSAIPRTGVAGYALSLQGSGVGDGFHALSELYGYGTLYADFATGAVTATGQVTYSNGISGTPLIKEFTGSAQFSSTANSFAGTLNFKGSGNFTGNWKGHLYGPDASELGSAFSLSGSGNTFFSGVILGGKTSGLQLDYTGLRDLTAPKTFPSFGATYFGGNPSNNADIVVTYDPTNNSYAFSPSGTPPVTYGNAQKDAASNASFAVYKMNQTAPMGPDDVLTATTLNLAPGNPTIALTYVSYTDIYTANGMTRFMFGTPNGDSYRMAVFGMNTPGAQLPSGGTASYSGIAVGNALTFIGADGGRSWALSGTSSFSFNFSNNSYNGSLALNGVDRMNAATRDFGTFNFSATAAAGTGYFSDANGSINTNFYGPQNAELGATFALQRRVGSEDQYIVGAALAKKVP